MGGGAFEEEGGEESGVWRRSDRRDGAEDESIDGWDVVVSDSGEPVEGGRGGRKREHSRSDRPDVGVDVFE